MTEEEIRQARELIERVRPDSWWGPDTDIYVRVGDLRRLIRLVEHTLRKPKRENPNPNCYYDLGEDWG